ncbi:uncharacterized protein K460DRAFT_364812 [Cucurbitaria berberidis CBS 394.84]|uniref:DUF6536 domain-containing protein n=1 Tax=Cucurbitaria berberidis CBS 394.84 TaxID=1168544 RepID=A0A9P4GP63_9PLEO|nr:uncharacterized protein K460DRAFT_364812 [Cucurbitaria berberidis CBS 394.84]KAF1848866.1 hypothetical protein K460DRAFT_364812 [Cucurbitaria berberidis CBS 394.84]
MLKDLVNVPKRWILSLSTRNTVYKQWNHANTTELQVLSTAEPNDNKSELYSLHSRTTKLFGAPKAWVTRFLGARFAGWRFGVLNFATWASIVFLINLIVTIWGSSATTKGKGVFFEGDCERVKRLNSALHVLINVLSTILLSGSNYCMQCLSAPTRKEIDRAHGNAGGTWLDIGVPGVRNIKHISRRRQALWSLLALSSLPLHLFYNSAVFSSLSANSYWAVSVSQSFINDTQCLNCTNVDYYQTARNRRPRVDFLSRSELKTLSKTVETLWGLARAGNLDRLEPAECLNQYAQTIQSNRRNLLLVGKDSNYPPPEENYFNNRSHIYWADMFQASSAAYAEQAADSYSWICAGLTDTRSCSSMIENIKRVPDAWQVGWHCRGDTRNECAYPRFPVEYCLSEKAEPHCKLHFEPNIAILITVLNLVKAALMFYIAFFISDEPIITMGDAIASFLEKSDSTTKNMCLVSLKDFKEKKGYTAGPRQWDNKRYKWKDVTSKTRRTVTLVMFLTALVLVSGLLGWGLVSLPTGTTLSRLGFGMVDPRTAMSGLPNDLLANVVLANTPQLILSFLYFSYNALLTAMLMGYEWTTYASKRKGLRVSHHPSGQQRSTYFLQLPYRFGVPLMILSGTLHWLVSQSIFLISLDYYDVFGNAGRGYFRGDQDLKTLGFSPSAIISVIGLGSLMVIAIVCFGSIPYKRGMPLAGSCSLAISAACHVLDGDETDGVMAAEQNLQWGVVSISHDGVGHCAFSTKCVEAPVEGEVYAGEQ